MEIETYFYDMNIIKLQLQLHPYFAGAEKVKNKDSVKHALYTKINI